MEELNATDVSFFETPGSDKTLANDGFLYMELEGGEKTWSRGVEGCAEKEGYRLGIYKTEDQKKVLEEYHAKVTRTFIPLLLYYIMLCVCF